jgi:hypothetical protein
MSQMAVALVLALDLLLVGGDPDVISGWPHCARSWVGNARELSEKRDTAALMALPSPSCFPERVELLRVLLLYSASPADYASRLVQRFPESREGLMGDLYEGVELPQFTPSFLYSYQALGEVAASGDPEAIRKVVIALLHVDGVVAEKMCEVAGKVVEAHQEEFARAACTSKGTIGQALSHCGTYLGESDAPGRLLLKIAAICGSTGRRDQRSP